MVTTAAGKSWLTTGIGMGPKYRRYVMVRTLIFWLGLLIFAGSLVVFNIWNNRWLYIIAAIIWFISSWDASYMLFKARTYRVKGSQLALEMTQGRWFFKRQTIFLSKIYSVEFRQNILMQHFDIATIIVKTVDHDVDIAGLATTEAHDLQNWLNSHAAR
ncbi:PH domain-containing protein [Periweissella ghanensis]|nr:PH domain-containing protein [Periweissella ghanensis]MCM0601203.1 PH domain-containing protein [Periweissella ghanensis]